MGDGVTRIAAGESRGRQTEHASRPARANAEQRIVRRAMVVGAVDDPAEREADEVAEHVMRAIASGATATAGTPAGHRVQRSATGRPSAAPPPAQRLQPTIRQGEAPVIRRKIGNDGKSLVGKKVRKTSDPKTVGEIVNWTYGGKMWALPGFFGLSDLVYEVRFGDRIVTVNGGDDGYELVPPGAEPPTATAPQAEAPARDPAADERTRDRLRQLAARLDQLKSTTSSQRAPHGRRRQWHKHLSTLSNGDAGKLPSDKVLEQYANEVKSIEDEFAAEAERLKSVNDEQQDAREQERKAALESSRIRDIEGRNRERLGKQYGQFTGKVRSAEKLEKLISCTPRGQEGHLLNCVQSYYVAKADGDDDLYELLGQIQPKDAGPLLRAIPTDAVNQLRGLLAHVTSSEYGTLGRLLAGTADDKTTLRRLLAKTGSATEAWTLMSNASPGSEASVLAMLNAGRSSADATELINTPAGRKDTADAATISAGVRDQDQARTLLQQPGVQGNAASALQVLRHQLVNGDIAIATQLLNKQGNAADALALLRDGCSLDEACRLLDTPGILGAGADAVWCRAQGCSVGDLVTLLGFRSATRIRDYCGAGFTFAELIRRLRAHPDQEFWAGETCDAPAIHGPARSIDEIIRIAADPPNVGQYSGGNRFGNHGGRDSHGKPVMVLPPLTGGDQYAEYDLAPFTASEDRGTRRIVVGGGHRYFTSDHYQTFMRFA